MSRLAMTLCLSALFLGCKQDEAQKVAERRHLAPAR